MDKDRMKGGAKEVAGEAEKQVGDMTGNRDLKDKGREHKTEGKIDKAAGKVKDAIRKTD
ncbi:CsbD family protein [Azospirillum sp. A39]|uniref:CsbD family protein n=1 Tax=Azospirillum sp. A39 TaxID=3462279 RepID=UPI0040457A7E